MKVFGPKQISLFLGTNQYTVNADSPHFNEAYRLLSSDEEGFIKLSRGSLPVEVQKRANEFLEKNGILKYGPFEIKGFLKKRILDLQMRKLSVEPFLRFFERLILNPSHTAVQELFDFLSYRDLAITDDGYFLGYKGVGSGYWSITGNTETIVLSGEVDKGGHILNKIGSTVRVARNCVDDNRKHHCAPGLHVGSLDYAKGWGERVIMVKVDPANAVCVPDDCQCQKLRVCEYEVIADFKQEIKSLNAKVEGEKIEEEKETLSPADVTVDRVKNYLVNAQKKGLDSVTVRQVANASRRHKVTYDEVRRIATNLRYKISNNTISL